MRNLLFVPAFSMLALAQAPVNYLALQKEVQSAEKAVSAAMRAEVKAGKPEHGAKPDFTKALKSIRARGRNAQGELREACLVAELAVVAQFDKDGHLATTILRDVPASSPSWKLALDILPFLPEIMGEPAIAYLQQMREQGIPEVRASLQAVEVGRLLEKGAIDEAKTLLAKLEKEFPGERSVQGARDSLTKELLTVVGSVAPDFQLTSLDNRQDVFTKATFKGRFLLLDFWGTWCQFCVQELPTTHKMYAEYKDKGLEILSLAVEKSPSAVLNFRKKPNTPMPWKHALIGTDTNRIPIIKAYGVNKFPSLFLIGPDGTILAKGENLREDKLESTLAEFISDKYLSKQ